MGIFSTLEDGASGDDREPSSFSSGDKSHELFFESGAFSDNLFLQLQDFWVNPSAAFQNTDPKHHDALPDRNKIRAGTPPHLKIFPVSIKTPDLLS